MPENEITCIFFEIDTGMSTNNQFRCEIERPFTNLNDISTKLAGKTYILEVDIPTKILLTIWRVCFQKGLYLPFHSSEKIAIFF